MKCPVCDATLRVIQKYGVEVDICPECKGVWLDRGELEKILALESTGGPVVGEAIEARRPASRPREEPRYRDEHRHRDDDDDDDDRYRRPQYDQHGQPRKRRGSWLGDLLEGFGGD